MLRGCNGGEQYLDAGLGRISSRAWGFVSRAEISCAARITAKKENELLANPARAFPRPKPSVKVEHSPVTSP